MINMIHSMVTSLSPVPISAWAWLAVYTASMLAVFWFGIPFKTRNSSPVYVSQTKVSHFGSNEKIVGVIGAVYTEANVITALGVLGQIILIWMILTETHLILVPIIFIIACVLSDGLDGVACDRHDCHSIFGEYLDPVRDRLSVGVIAIVIFSHSNPTLFLLFALVCVVELIIIETAREAYVLDIPHSSVGGGQFRQAIHLLAIEAILIAQYVPGVDSEAVFSVACFSLIAMFLGSAIACYGYFRHLHFEKHKRKFC